MSVDDTMIDDKTGLVSMGFLLIAIALKGNETDMSMAARGVSSLDGELVSKYWELMQNTQEMFNEAIRSQNKA